MHFNFHFTAAEILWTLTFAALLVLLVVLLGRERIRRFPIFTSSIVLIGLNMLAQKLVANRFAPLISTEIFLVLADLGVVIALLLAVELARRAFSAAKWPAWVVGSLVLLGGAAAVIAFWGQWPPAKMAFDPSTLGHLRLMQLIAQKGDLFNQVLAVELFALVVIAGRRFKTGWRSHTQQILAGISTSSAMLIAARVIWETMAHNAPRTPDGNNHMLDLQAHLQNAYSMVVLAVMVWWIVCLWIDEPGAASVAASVDANAPAAVETLDTWIAKPAAPASAPEE
ncbi:MAG: hypothetical protein ACLQHF_12630 [Terracidiphilus sp.]